MSTLAISDERFLCVALYAGLGMIILHLLLEYSQARKTMNAEVTLSPTPAAAPAASTLANQQLAADTKVQSKITLQDAEDNSRHGFHWPPESSMKIVLCIPEGIDFEINCPTEDIERYKLYIANAWADLCAKIEARISTPYAHTKSVIKHVDYLRQNALAKHSIAFPLPDSHGLTFTAYQNKKNEIMRQVRTDRLTSAELDLPNASRLRFEQFLMNIVALVALDCMTKCSEHLLHAPRRISYLFNTVVAPSYANVNGQISFTLPPIKDLLRGHEELSTADPIQQNQENEITLYDLDVYSSLFYLSKRTKSDFGFWEGIFPPKRQMKLVTIFSVILLKIVFYWPLLQIKLWVLFIMLHLEYGRDLQQLIFWDSVVSLGVRVLAISLRLWLIQSWMFSDVFSPITGTNFRCTDLLSWKQWINWHSSNKMWMAAALSYTAQGLFELFIIISTSTANESDSTLTVLITLRIVLYIVANVGQVVASARDEYQRPMKMALQEITRATLFVLLPICVIMYYVESSLFGMLENILQGGLCQDSYGGTGILTARLNGCHCLLLFALLIFLTDVYPVYIVVLSLFGLFSGLIRRYPFQRTLTPAGVKALGRKLFPTETDEKSVLAKTANILKKGMNSLRMRDLVSTDTTDDFENSLDTLVASPINCPENESLSFDLRSLDTLELHHVFSHLLTHAQQEDARTPSRPSWAELPSITHLLPVCGETILFSYSDLMRTEDPQNQLKALVYNNQQEFLYFLERMHDADIMSIITDEDRKRVKNMCVNGDTSWVREFVKQSNQSSFELELRLWTSLRGQTVARTIIGMCEYSRVLCDILELEGVTNEDQRRATASKKVQVLVCDQLFAARPENKTDLETVLNRIQPELPVEIAFDYDGTKPNHMTSEIAARLPTTRFASGRMVWDRMSGLLKLVEVLPRTYALRIGCDADNLTQGKAGNQRNGTLFARGDIVQAIDANQCWYYLEALFVPMALSLFYKNPKERKFPRVRIMGFAERIFTMPLNPVAAAEGLSEFSFGTLVQRALSLCGVRLHYGHPDFIESSFLKYHGGMSLASAKINLSEDIFQGYKAVLHGYKSEHIEFLMMGKARETNLPGATKFNMKIAMGAGCGVNRSPEALDMVLKIDTWRATVNYLATCGWYDFQVLALWSTFTLVLTFMITVVQKSTQDLLNVASAQAAFAAAFVQLAFGMLPVLIGVFELILRFSLGGLSEALKTTFLGFGDYVFQSMTRQSAFTRAILKRKAVYLATGRSLGFQKQDPISLVSSYCSTHLFPCLFVLEYAIMFQLLAALRGSATGGIPFLPIIYVVNIFVLISPSLYNPDQTFDTIKQDYSKILPRYLQVKNTLTTEQEWKEKGFDAQVTEMGKESFTNTFFVDFLFCQDSWENHLTIWVMWGVFKMLFFAALMTVSNVDKGVISIVISLWCMYAAHRFRYRVQHSKLFLFVANDLWVLGLILMLCALGMFVVACIVTEHGSFFDVVAAIWMLIVLLRQCINVCMISTSIAHFRKAVYLARTRGLKREMYRVFTLQQEMYWPLYKVFMIDLVRRISIVWVWMFGIIGAILSMFMWSFYLKSATVRYVDRHRMSETGKVNTPMTQHFIRDNVASSVRFVRDSPEHLKPRPHSFSFSPYASKSDLKSLASPLMASPATNPESGVGNIRRNASLFTLGGDPNP